MITPRVIPVLLLRGNGLVKGVKFKDHRYVGDAMNAVKIFSEKEADELILLDITASKENRIPSLSFIKDVANECYMPFGVGGGIRNIEHIRMLLNSGAEKVIINTAAVENPDLIDAASRTFGAQAVVVSVDVKKGWNDKYSVYIKAGTVNTRYSLFSYLHELEERGAGEIFLNSIDKDGTMSGYDINLIKSVVAATKVPVIACGGASDIDDLRDAVQTAGAQATAAGAMFVFHGKMKGVLITYPDSKTKSDLFKSKSSQYQLVN